MNASEYSTFRQALESAERAGDLVIRYIVAHWSDCRDRVPGN
jgi:purine nucleoside permease